MSLPFPIQGRQRWKNLAAPDDGEVEEDDGENPPNLILEVGSGGGSVTQSAWTLIAHNKRVLEGWESLAANTPENATNAYDWLSMNAMKWKPGRCYPLRGKAYAGCWCYEIGSGDRIYYKPDQTLRRAVVYYAGSHPKATIPAPPKNL